MNHRKARTGLMKAKPRPKVSFSADEPPEKLILKDRTYAHRRPKDFNEKKKIKRRISSQSRRKNRK